MNKMRGSRASVIALALLIGTGASSIAQSAQLPDSTRVRVELVGLTGQLRDNALAVLAIAGAADRGRLPTAEIRRLHGRAPQEIRLSLQPFGYYRAAIRSQLTEDGTWVARFEVDPGPALRLARVTARVVGAGESDPEFAAALSNFPLAAGDTLRHDKYEAGKRALAQVAGERGYLDAAFDTAVILVDTAAYSAEIVVRFNTGPRYRFGPVTFQQEILDPRLFQGYVKFSTGEAFEASKLFQLQSDLSSTPYFSRVDVRPQREQADSLQVPIEIKLTPRRPRRYEVGLGYGTDTGIRGTLEAEFRRINRRGHTGTARVEVSQIEKSISAQYRFPPAYPRTATWALGAGFGDFSPTWSNSVRAVGSVSRSTDFLGGREALSLSFENENYTIAGEDGESTLLIPSLDWSRVRADNMILTRHGGRIRLSFRGSLDAVLSTASFFQARATAKIVRSLAPRTRFLSRAQLGYTFTRQFGQLPPSIRFVTGGDQTVRGYAFESLGPRNENGGIVGGDLLIVGSIELDQLVYKKFGLAAFFDIGNALDAVTDSRLVKGVGAGLRWASPVGPIRLDGAYALSPFALTDPNSRFRIHFTMGPDL